jgi:hypothetical protein
MEYTTMPEISEKLADRWSPLEEQREHVMAGPISEVE